MSCPLPILHHSRTPKNPWLNSRAQFPQRDSVFAGPSVMGHISLSSSSKLAPLGLNTRCRESWAVALRKFGDSARMKWPAEAEWGGA